MLYNKVLLIICVVLSFTLSEACLMAKAPYFYTDDPGKVMLDGNDVLTYYTNAVPVPGLNEFQAEFQGVKWNFANKTNLNKLLKNPQMYIPEFGGYSVWALAHGRLKGGESRIWKVVEGRLYLFCSESAREKWMAQRELIIRLAQENWPEILDQY